MDNLPASELEIIVPSTIRPGCKIAVVGEAPGENEVREGEGFVGQAGRVLNRILQVGGLSRESVSLLNVVKRPPRGGYDSKAFQEDFYEMVQEETTTSKILKRCNICGKNAKQHEGKKAKHEFIPLVKFTTKKGKKKTVPTKELLQYREYLRDELVGLGPNLVIAAGGEALRTLTGLDGISNFRGSVLESTLIPGLKVVPILHPSYILRSAQWQEAYISGLIVREKVIPESKFPEILKETWEELPPEPDQIGWFCDRIATHNYIWTLDIETRGGSIACVGLGCIDEFNYIHAICIPFQTTTGPYWESASVEFEVWKCIYQAMDNPNLVGQNIMFDLDHLSDYGLYPVGVRMDTMLAHHVLYPELPKGLDMLTMRFTRIPYYKEEGKTWGVREPDKQLWKYNIKDIVAQLLSAVALEKLLKKEGKEKEYYEFTNALIPVALEMQQRGFDVDGEAKRHARGLVKEETEWIHQKLIASVGHEVSVGSSQQMSRLLYDELGLKKKFNRKTKKLTTDEDAVMELFAENPTRRELKYIIGERHLNKLRENYIDFKEG